MARTIVLRKLTAAPRTRAQLADDLRRRATCPDEVAEQVLDRFTEVGLIDDPAFAGDLGPLPARHRAGCPAGR